MPSHYVASDPVKPRFTQRHTGILYERTASVTERLEVGDIGDQA